MDHFIDKPDYKESLAYITSQTTVESIKQAILEKLPGWLQYSLDFYSKDYKYLEDNWTKICSMSGSTKQKIILVEDIQFDDDHKLVRGICEFLTRMGYCVRRTSEYQPCSVCHGAIPTIEVWHLMKEKNLAVPKEWSKICSSCVFY